MTDWYAVASDCPSWALASSMKGSGSRSAGTFARATSVLMYFMVLSRLPSSLVIAATFSLTVLPPVKATVSWSPTLTPCLVAYSEPTDIAFAPYAAACSPATILRRMSLAYVGSVAPRPTSSEVPSGAVTLAATSR